jgi:hypothetical protein
MHGTMNPKNGGKNFGIGVLELPEGWRSIVRKAVEWSKLPDKFIINRSFKITSLLCH